LKSLNPRSFVARSFLLRSFRLFRLQTSDLLISIIIPVYHDTDALARTLAALRAGAAEVVVASTPDDAESLARLQAAHPDVVWIEATRGRAVQMNAGARIARGSWLLFLHADTRLPDEWAAAVAEGDADCRVSFGFFRVALDS